MTQASASNNLFYLIPFECGKDLEGVYKNVNREGWNQGAIASVYFFFSQVSVHQ